MMKSKEKRRKKKILIIVTVLRPFFHACTSWTFPHIYGVLKQTSSVLSTKEMKENKVQRKTNNEQKQRTNIGEEQGRTKKQQEQKMNNQEEGRRMKKNTEE